MVGQRLKILLICMIVSLMILATAGTVRADGVPPHISSMAAQLYKDMKDTLSGSDLNREKREALTHSKKVLEDLGVKSWSDTPYRLSPDDIEQLDKNYQYTSTSGETIDMGWYPKAEKFYMNVTKEAEDSVDDYTASYLGDVVTTKTGDGKISLETRPASARFKALTKEDFKALDANIIGTWKESSGDIYHIRASAREFGKIRPSAEIYNEQIDELKDKIKTLKSAKIFIWKHEETGEIVRQDKFRRLNPPYEYEGEELAVSSAEDDIDEMEKRIRQLEAERDGENLRPQDKDDPVGYDDSIQKRGAQPISIRVSQPDGYSYSYEQAVFDGRKIKAKRTHDDPRSLNDVLPDDVKQRLISEGWNPPVWINLQAAINPEDGTIMLAGQKWGMHVTYDPAYNNDIDNIHTPYSWGLTLTKDYAGYKTAEGATEEMKL